VTGIADRDATATGRMVSIQILDQVAKLFVVQALVCSSSGRTGAISAARDRSEWEENTHPRAHAWGCKYADPCGDYPETEFPHGCLYDNHQPAVFQE
jgi:hypothetical protein